MPTKLKKSLEEELIIKVFFSKKNNYDYNFNQISFEKLVKILSTHLMLPAFYVKLREKKLLHKIPLDLKDYLNNIYLINRARNNEILNIVSEITSLLNDNKITHYYFKGCSMLIKNYYVDIGERMIKDIDIIVEKKNYEKTKHLLNKKKFFSNYSYKLWKTHIQPPLINWENGHVIDLHNNPLPKKFEKLLDFKKIKDSSLSLNGFQTLSDANEVYSIIYNQQLGDYGYLKLNYSFKKFYDIELLSKFYDLKKLDQNKFIDTFFMISSIMGIEIINDKKKSENVILKYRFKLKKRVYLYYRFDNFICNLIIQVNILPKKIIEFLFNESYRLHVLKKLKELTFG